MRVKLSTQEKHIINRELEIEDRTILKHMILKDMFYDVVTDICTLCYQTSEGVEHVKFDIRVIEEIIERPLTSNVDEYSSHFLSETGLNICNPYSTFTPAVDLYKVPGKPKRKWNYELCLELSSDEYQELEVYMSNLLEDLNNY